MKKVILLSALLVMVLASCNCSKTTSSSSAKSVEPSSAPVSSNTSAEEMDLEGTWELVSIVSETLPFKDLFTGQKKTIVFDARPKQVSGSTSCNTYTGSYALDGRALSFGNGMAMTKMACQGNGEAVYVERLNKANMIFIKDQSTLMLLDGNTALLEFKKIMGAKSY